MPKLALRTPVMTSPCVFYYSNRYCCCFAFIAVFVLFSLDTLLYSVHRTAMFCCCWVDEFISSLSVVCVCHYANCIGCYSKLLSVIILIHMHDRSRCVAPQSCRKGWIHVVAGWRKRHLYQTFVLLSLVFCLHILVIIYLWLLFKCFVTWLHLDLVYQYQPTRPVFCTKSSVWLVMSQKWPRVCWVGH